MQTLPVGYMLGTPVAVEIKSKACFLWILKGQTCVPESLWLLLEEGHDPSLVFLSFDL